MFFTNFSEIFNGVSASRMCYASRGVFKEAFLKLLSIFALALGVSAAAFAQDDAKVIMPTVRGSHPQSGAKNPTIVYHGGPVQGTVVGQPVHLYYIFYGDWATIDPGGPKIMKSFAHSLGGSAYWNILTTYVEPSGAFIQNAVTLAGFTNDLYSQGTQLNDSTLQIVVQTAITNGSLPLDTNALYLVATTPDVNETSGWCTQYCGFHGYMTFQNANIKYAFIGDPVGCVAQGGVADCNAQPTNYTASPNNDPGVDAMISVIAHEAEESTSDPNLNAWYFNTGAENGDQCAYTYGKLSKPLPNGSVSNIKLGGKLYLIQQDYIAPNLGCAMGYTTP